MKLSVFVKPSEEWEVVGFCPNCKVSMMTFYLEYEKGYETGRICPKCGFIYDPSGMSDMDGLGHLRKITVGYAV